MTEVKDKDLTALYHLSDRLSLKAQSNYFLLIRINLFFLVSAAIISTCSGGITIVDKQWLKIAVAIIFLCTVIISFISKILQFEKQWYVGRTVAESAKSLSWKYIMRSEPFASQDADTTFLKEMKLLVEARKSYLGVLNSKCENDSNSEYITDKMKSIRQMDTASRKELYLKERLGNQKEWYQKKSKYNNDKKSYWFYGLISIQTLAVIVSIILVRYPDYPFNLPSVFSALAASILAWTQAKNFQELSQSYAYTAFELQLVEESGKQIEDEMALSRFVSDAENAISREHTNWIARRDHVL